MKNGTKLQIINEMCKCLDMFLKKNNRQLNSRSAACSSFKYKKEKSYYKRPLMYI